MFYERLVGKGFLLDRWMLRTAGWKGCNEEPADDMKCDDGFCTETRSAWRRSMAAREEHDVEGDERRHDRAKTSLARRTYVYLHMSFLQFQCREVSWFYKFQTDIPEHFGLKLIP